MIDYRFKEYTAYHCGHEKTCANYFFFAYFHCNINMQFNLSFCEHDNQKQYTDEDIEDITWAREHTFYLRVLMISLTSEGSDNSL